MDPRERRGQEFQSLRAWQEEIAASLDRDETLEAMQPQTSRFVGYGHAAGALRVVIGRYGILVVVQSVELGVVDPRLLDEFELPSNIGVDRHEHHALFGFPIFVFVTPAAPDDPVAVCQPMGSLYVRRQSVTWVRAADM